MATWRLQKLLSALPRLCAPAACGMSCRSHWLSQRTSGLPAANTTPPAGGRACVMVYCEYRYGRATACTWGPGTQLLITTFEAPAVAHRTGQQLQALEQELIIHMQAVGMASGVCICAGAQYERLSYCRSRPHSTEHLCSACSAEQSRSHAQGADLLGKRCKERIVASGQVHADALRRACRAHKYVRGTAVLTHQLLHETKQWCTCTPLSACLQPKQTLAISSGTHRADMHERRTGLCMLRWWMLSCDACSYRSQMTLKLS